MKKEPDQLLTADPTKEKFEIKITIAQNCHQIKVTGVGDYTPTYHEIIGALELIKYGFIHEQNAANMREINPELKTEK